MENEWSLIKLKGFDYPAWVTHNTCTFPGRYTLNTSNLKQSNCIGCSKKIPDYILFQSRLLNR